MTDSESTALHRRRFLKGMVVAGGATIATPTPGQAQTPVPEKPNSNASPPKCPWTKSANWPMLRLIVPARLKTPRVSWIARLKNSNWPPPEETFRDAAAYL